MKFDLTFQNYTTIENLGNFEKSYSKPLKIEFSDIPKNRGCITFQAYLRNVFIKKNNASNDYIGVLFDGDEKVDVILNNYKNEEINFKRGSNLEIIGDVDETGKKKLLKI